MDDIEVLEPDAQAVPLSNGSVIEVAPLKVGQLPAFLRAIRPLANWIQTSDSGEIDLVDAFMEAPEAFIDAVQVATGVPADVLESLGLDDLVALSKAVIEVNADFFVRRVAPLLREAGRVPEEAAPPGPSSANG